MIPDPGAASSAPDDLADVLAFLRDLWAVGHAMESTSRRLQDAIGITGPQRMIIRILGRHPGMVAGDLARLLHVDAGTLSAALARLEARGLVTRHKDADDQRRVRIRLTEAGETLDVPREDSLEGAVGRVLTRSTEAERAALHVMLERIAHELEVQERASRP